MCFCFGYDPRPSMWNSRENPQRRNVNVYYITQLPFPSVSSLISMHYNPGRINMLKALRSSVGVREILSGVISLA